MRPLVLGPLRKRQRVFTQTLPPHQPGKELDVHLPGFLLLGVEHLPERQRSLPSAVESVVALTAEEHEVAVKP